MTGLALPPIDVPGIMKKFGLRPRVGLGQNFLQDDRALREIVHAADIKASDEVLEIGPGVGNLTRYLALAARHVVAVELDKDLFPALEGVLAPYKNIHLMQGDILGLNPQEIIEQPNYLVVANIPYYITSAVLRHLLESEPRPRRMVLTMQEEVAARICSKPGRMSLLSLSVQLYGTPEIVAYIPAEAFFPIPKVDSAVLRVELLQKPLLSPDLIDTFFILIKAGFSQKRKTLRNSLSSGLGIAPPRSELILSSAGIDPRRRAETLSIEEWGNLCGVWKEKS
jgi:16S rRNA (adenine1518-N6/adenine1519-N6)-dimethyltransferase